MFNRIEVFILRCVRVLCILFLVGLFINTMITSFKKLQKGLIGTSVYTEVDVNVTRLGDFLQFFVSYFPPKLAQI